jgi:hypothetical protein
MSIDLGAALTGAGTVVLAFCFFYFPWQSFVVDQTRQRLFEIRDSWFDYSQSLTGADRDAALSIRNELNFMIKIAERFSLPVLIYTTAIHFLFCSEKVHEHENSLFGIVGKFQQSDARNEATKVLSNAIGQLAMCMLRRSLIALTLVPVVFLVTVLISATMGTAIRVGECLKGLIADVAFHDFQLVGWSGRVSDPKHKGRNPAL